MTLNIAEDHAVAKTRRCVFDKSYFFVKARILVAVLLAAGFVVPARADVRSGLADFRQGRFAEAYVALTAAAIAGDPRAARYVGVLYDTGEGVRQDRAEAVEWYRRAAGLGDPIAMFNVAVSYDSGIGIARNHRQAARWYRRAAALHDSRAEYNLALMYRSGDGVPRSPAEAEQLFQAAARDGASAGAGDLSRPPADAIRRVVTHSAHAPDDDTAFLQAQRALLSRQPQETANAVVLFQQAAAAGGPASALALYDLGWCYENGMGVTANAGRAYALYVRAAAVTDDQTLRDLAETGAVALRARPDPTPADDTSVTETPVPDTPGR